MDTETERTVASFLRERQRQDSLPGVAVAVAGGAGTTGASSEWAAGVGARGLGGNRSGRPETVFPVGGATPPRTAPASTRGT